MQETDYVSHCKGFVSVNKTIFFKKRVKQNISRLQTNTDSVLTKVCLKNTPLSFVKIENKQYFSTLFCIITSQWFRKVKRMFDDKFVDTP